MYFGLHGDEEIPAGTLKMSMSTEMVNKQVGRKLTETFDGIIVFIKVKYIYQHMTEQVRFC